MATCSRIQLLCSVLFVFVASGMSSRILAIYPVPLKSFFYFNEAILKTLHSAGHDITFVNPFPDERKTLNYTTIGSMTNESTYFGRVDVDHFSSMSTRAFAKMMIDIEDKYCDHVIQLPVIQKALSNSTHYDVMFVGMIQMYECYFSLADALKIPVIGTVNYRSWPSERIVGNPFSPAVVPLVWSSHGKTMNFRQRLANAWNIFTNDFLYYFVVSPKLQDFNDRHFPSTRTSSGMSRQPALMFINSHLTLQPRPMVPNAIEIGGIHIQPKKPLPKDLERFIDEAEHGVVLFSLGSVLKTSSLSPAVVKAFVDAFAVLPQRVVWKFENEIPGLSENVYTSSWLPQRDILEHPNVKVFISHCGLGGMYEAIYSGTPIIATPFFCDQRSNTALLVDLGVAIELDVKNVTKERILAAVNIIINDTTISYSDRMDRLSDVFRDRPMSAQQAVVYWTEYVIKYGGARHLRSLAADLPLYQYLLLDIIGVVFLIVISLYSVVLYVTRKKCCSIVNIPRKSSSIESKKKK